MASSPPRTKWPNFPPKHPDLVGKGSIGTDVHVYDQCHFPRGRKIPPTIPSGSSKERPGALELADLTKNPAYNLPSFDYQAAETAKKDGNDSAKHHVYDKPSPTVGATPSVSQADGRRLSLAQPRKMEDRLSRVSSDVLWFFRRNKRSIVYHLLLLAVAAGVGALFGYVSAARQTSGTSFGETAVLNDSATTSSQSSELH